MELKDTIDEIGRAFQGFRGDYDNRLNNLTSQINAIETAAARMQHTGGGVSSHGVGITPESREHTQQFLSWVRNGGNEAALRDFEIQARSGSTFSDPDGGFLVADELEQRIERLALDSVAMRRLARIVKSTGEYKKPLSKGGAGGGWVGEQDARAETDTPELTMFAPPMCEAYALPKVTQKLLDLSEFDVAGWLVEEISDVIINLEGAGFISGNGVKQPKGFLDYTTVADASWAYGKVGYIASGNASLLTNADKLFSLQHSLKPVYRRNGTWVMNDRTLETIRTFKDGNGNYIWRPGLLDGAPDMLLGKPVEIDDSMPDIGTNSYPIAFGDWKRAYTIVDHTSGLRLLRDPFTQKGWVLFYLTKRVTGGISNFEAIKLLKVSA